MTSKTVWPFTYVPDPDKGRPLFQAKLYFGEVDQNPKQFPKQAFAIQEDGTEVPLPSSINTPAIFTGSGGVPEYNGLPVRISIEGNYSFLVEDRLGAQKYFVEDAFLDDPTLFFDSVADMMLSITATNLANGTMVSTARYNTSIAQNWIKTDVDPVDFTNGYYVAGIGVWFTLVQSGSNELFVEETGLNPLGTHANNKLAIETALLVALQQGLGTVSFRDYATPQQLVMVGSDIQLHRGIKIKMHGGDAGGAFLGGIVGDGNGPIFLTGTYTPGGANTPSLIREITFENLSAENTNGHPVAEIFSPNFKAIQGRYKTLNSETLKFRFAFRATIRGGRHESTWTAPGVNNYTITAYDNINGLLITPDTIITGGSNGGGIDVSQSQKVNVDGIFETMGNQAIRIAGYDGLERGNCSGVRVAGYMENCPGSLSVGLENRVTGLTLGEMVISQVALTSTPDFVIALGKVSGVGGGHGINIVGEGSEPAFLFTQGAAGSGSLSPENVYLEGIQVSDVGSDYEIDPALNNSQRAAAFNDGRVQIGDSDLTGNIREYLSSTLTANVGNPIDFRFINTIATSGFIDKVEMLEAVGDLTGASLRIGDTLNASRNMNQALDATAPSGGYVDYSAGIVVSNLRATEPTNFKVTAGSGTGTFRIKITYRT